MPKIFYYTNSAGTPVAKWPGRSVRREDGNRKEGQFYLGRVVNKAENVFYKSKLGYYRFDPETLECLPISEDEVPAYDGPVDDREREETTCIFFGGAYLIDCLVNGIGYTEVLDAIPVADRDTLMAMVHYYTLENKAVNLAELWYEANYASLLYPHARVSCQHISALLSAMGTEEARMRFLRAHGTYLAKTIDDPHCELAVSTYRIDDGGARTATDVRLITVAERSSGLPVRFEVIPAGIDEADVVENVTHKLHLYGFEVDSVSSGDERCDPAAASTRGLATEGPHPGHCRALDAARLFDDVLGIDRMCPRGERTMEAIGGHLLLSFVATFLRTLVENRMDIAGTRYVAPPRTLCDSLTEADGEAIVVELPDGTTQTVLEQDPFAETPCCPPDAALYAVGLWPAKVLDNAIVPATPTPEALETFSTFGLRRPHTIVHEGHTLTPLNRSGEPDRCTRARTFSTRPAITDDEIEARRAKANDRKPKANEVVPDDPASPQEGEPKPAKRRGRPKGSKNKRTLEREAEEKRLAELGLLPPKRGRGRPKGSKNKKTLEREAAERARLEAR